MAPRPSPINPTVAVRESDRAIIAQYTDKGFVDEPTHVMHLYKNRGNPLVNIRIYGRFVRNQCRWYDCFVTDFQGHMLEITPIKVTWDAPEEPEKKEETEKAAQNEAKIEKLKAIDFGDINVRDDELPFDFSDSKPQPTGWGVSMDEEYVDPATVVGPFSQEDPIEQPQAPAEDDGSGGGDTAWGSPYGGLDF